MPITRKIISEAKKKVKRKEEGDSFGSFCDFYKITDKIGLKLYTYKSLRDKCFTYQKYANKHRLAPKTIGKIKVGKQYGYLTEIAKTRYISEGRLEALREKLEKIGMTDYDIRSDNAGYIKKRIVLLDFSETSLSKNTRLCRAFNKITGCRLHGC